MQLFKLKNFLNNLLDNNKFSDYALNGLQVENNGNIEKIFTSVDANFFTINKCTNNSILIVHHGIFWDKPVSLTGSNYEKIKLLFEKNVALYASHLPLDAHPEIGNNALIIKGLNAEIFGIFGEYNGNYIGYKGEFEEQLDLFIITEKLQNLINDKIRVLNFGKNDKIKRIAVVSGAPGRNILNQYLDSQTDLLITGEASHELYNFAEDNKINILCAGHYGTETIGVKALGKYAAREFLLECEFIDHPTGL